MCGFCILAPEHVYQSMELCLTSISLCLGSGLVYTLLVENQARVVVKHSWAISLTNLSD